MNDMAAHDIKPEVIMTYWRGHRTLVVLVSTVLSVMQAMDACINLTLFSHHKGLQPVETQSSHHCGLARDHTRTHALQLHRAMQAS